jgi:hypothetical protein
MQEVGGNRITSISAVCTHRQIDQKSQKIYKMGRASRRLRSEVYSKVLLENLKDRTTSMT